MTINSLIQKPIYWQSFLFLPRMFAAGILVDSGNWGQLGPACELSTKNQKQKKATNTD